MTAEQGSNPGATDSFAGARTSYEAAMWTLLGDPHVRREHVPLGLVGEYDRLHDDTGIREPAEAAEALASLNEQYSGYPLSTVSEPLGIFVDGEINTLRDQITPGTIEGSVYLYPRALVIKVLAETEAEIIRLNGGQHPEELRPWYEGKITALEWLLMRRESLDMVQIPNGQIDVEYGISPLMAPSARPYIK